MMERLFLRLLSIKIFLILLFITFTQIVIAQTPTDTPTPTPTSAVATPTPTTVTVVAAPTPTPNLTPDNTEQKNKLQDQIAQYEKKIGELQGTAKTLSSQISLMDSQIALTELRISQTQQQIDNLNKDITITKVKISQLETDINVSTKALLNRIVATYQVGRVEPWQVFLTSDSITNFFTRLKYLRIVQAHDKRNVYASEQSKVNYASEKKVLEDKQQEQEQLRIRLQGYTTQLNSEKKAKQSLLNDTKNDESRYQRMLADAKAQLAALSNFTRSRVGSGGGIIPHQEQSDGWGKYYNQRDANWGNNYIGLSREQVWEVGCLLTSYAMVITHYGGSLTPADVAGNPDNFSYSTAYFKKPGPDANGHSVRSVDNPSLGDLRTALNNGQIIIAGLSNDGGPFPQHYSDHWVVLRSVDGDTFRINDPWYEGAMNVPLTDHYAGWAIIEARIYQ